MLSIKFVQFNFTVNSETNELVQEDLPIIRVGKVLPVISLGAPAGIRTPNLLIRSWPVNLSF